MTVANPGGQGDAREGRWARSRWTAPLNQLAPTWSLGRRSKGVEARRALESCRLVILRQRAATGLFGLTSRVESPADRPVHTPA
jgi:hypothetical protein